MSAKVSFLRPPVFPPATGSSIKRRCRGDHRGKLRSPSGREEVRVGPGAHRNEFRMQELIEGIGARSDVVIKIFGDDLDTLKTEAEHVGRVISTVKGAADVKVQQVTRIACSRDHDRSRPHRKVRHKCRRCSAGHPNCHRGHGSKSRSRENGQRRISVEVNVRGRDIGSFVKDAQQKIENEIKLPPAYLMTWAACGRFSKVAGTGYCWSCQRHSF